jgi:hypothetical protein
VACPAEPEIPMITVLWERTAELRKLGWRGEGASGRGCSVSGQRARVSPAVRLATWPVGQPQLSPAVLRADSYDLVGRMNSTPPLSPGR